MLELELWSPFKKSMPLVGLLSKSGRVVCYPAEIADVLGNEWAPIFAEKSMHGDTAAQVASKWIAPTPLLSAYRRLLRIPCGLRSARGSRR